MNTLASLQIFGLLSLVLAYVSILLWIFRPGSKAFYDKQSNIPLKNDINNGEVR